MSCYHPRTAILTSFKDYIDPNTGEYFEDKIQVNIVAYDTLELEHKEKIKSKLLTNQRLVEFPCCECDGCKESDKKEWATRIWQESLCYQNNQMVSLTYNNENVPKTKDGQLTLKKKDLQDFMKRLRTTYYRKHDWEGIRYKACGEYGGDDDYLDTNGELRKGTERPHYHFVGLNLPVYDLIPHHISKTDGQVYISPELTQIWGKGHVTVVEASWNTCAYVAGYVLKKANKDQKQKYLDSGRLPEFTTGSNRPGIGKPFFDKFYKQIYETDEMIIKRRSKEKNWELETVTVKPSRYYDKLFERIDPERMKEIKQARREASEEAEKIKYSKISKSRKSYLEQVEARHKESLKILKQRKMQRVA